jgi:hypothetical protein
VFGIADSCDLCLLNVFFCINLLNVWLWTKFPCAMDFLSFNEMILLMLEMSAFAVSTISKEKT